MELGNLGVKNSAKIGKKKLKKYIDDIDDKNRTEINCKRKRKLVEKYGNQ